MESASLNEYRCKCGRLLFKGALLTCKLEIKCKRCGGIKTIIYNNGNSILKEHYVGAFNRGRFSKNKERAKNNIFRKKSEHNSFLVFFVALFLNLGISLFFIFLISGIL